MIAEPNLEGNGSDCCDSQSGEGVSSIHDKNLSVFKEIMQVTELEIFHHWEHERYSSLHD